MLGTQRRVPDDEGAVAVMTAAVVMVLVLVAAFAVDLGMQRVARRDMQSLADVVALDLVRELDGTRTVAQLAPRMPGLALASQRRNAATLGTTPVFTIALGATGANGDFVEQTGSAVPSAVRVTSSTSVGFAFVPGAGGASRTAVAAQVAGACFTIGSYAARFNAGQSPVLGPLLGGLGSSVTLSLLDYNGLANTRVDLADLLNADLGAVTVEEAIRGDRLVRLGDYFLAVASVLPRSGNAAQITLLESIAARLGSASLHAGRLLGLDTGGGAGLDAALNLLDLVTAGAAAANGQGGIVIPGGAVNLGPVANVRTGIRVVEPVRAGCGRKNDPGSVASSGQVSLTLDASALDVNLLVARTRVSLAGTVTAAGATGRLTDVRCDPVPGATVAVTDSLVNVDLTLNVSLSVLGIPIGGPIRVTGVSPRPASQARIDVPDGNYDRFVRVGTNNSGLPFLRVDTSGVRLLGIGILPLRPVTDALVGQLVNPFMQALDTVLLAPLLSSLGIDLSGADIRLRPTPRCGEPALRG